jgi:hypothetical protein
MTRNNNTKTLNLKQFCSRLIGLMLAAFFCSFAAACEKRSLILGETKQFNEVKFLENVQKIHLKPKEMRIYSKNFDEEVRGKLKNFVQYDETRVIMRALDEICANIVGRIMFKVLMTKIEVNNILKNRGKLKILEHVKDGSEYSHQKKDFAVKINLNFYEPSGVGKPERRYYYINKEGEIKTKPKSLAGSLFHEFCHALHDVSETRISSRKNVLCLDGTPFKDVWSTDEELRTITCFLDSNSGCYDPICDHCFDQVQSIMKNESFRPRYSHGGYTGIEEPNFIDLYEFYKCIPASKKYMNGWMEYVIC